MFNRVWSHQNWMITFRWLWCGVVFHVGETFSINCLFLFWRCETDKLKLVEATKVNLSSCVLLLKVFRLFIYWLRAYLNNALQLASIKRSTSIEIIINLIILLFYDSNNKLWLNILMHPSMTVFRFSFLFQFFFLFFFHISNFDHLRFWIFIQME